MTSARLATPADRTHRLGLAALTIASLAIFVWLVASLASAAFGS